VVVTAVQDPIQVEALTLVHVEMPPIPQVVEAVEVEALEVFRALLAAAVLVSAVKLSFMLLRNLKGSYIDTVGSC
jgi:hypothetical protein